MTTRSHEADPNALDRHLVRMRTDLIFPDTPDIASAFALDGGTRLSEPPRTRSYRVAPLSWKVLAATAVMIGVLALAIPEARSTLANWFDFGGIRIEVGTGDQQGQTPPVSIGGTLLLGRQVSTEDAEATAPFEILVPADERIDGAPETYLLRRGDAVVVSLLYPPAATLPEIGTTGVGLLLMQIDSPEHTTALVKRSMNERPPVTVMVNGATGAWIEGGTLAVEPVYESGVFERSSGNVLIWEQNGVTYRMESALTMTDAVALVEGF